MGQDAQLVVTQPPLGLDMELVGSAEGSLVHQEPDLERLDSCQDQERRKIEEVERSHWLVQGSHLAGRIVVVAVEEEEEAVLGC